MKWCIIFLSAFFLFLGDPPGSRADESTLCVAKDAKFVLRLDVQAFRATALGGKVFDIARSETVLPRRLVRPNAVSHRRKRAVRGAVGAMLFGTTAAACVWFTMSHSRSPTDQAKQPKPEETRHIVKENPAVPITAADREWLQTAWRRSRANLSQLHERATNLPGRSDLLNVSGYSAIIEPAETAGSATGRALAMLDRGMTSQQQQLTSDSRAAVSFFVERLPASLAKLVRWKKRQ